MGTSVQTVQDLLSPTEDELRAAAIDELDEFASDAPMIIENIDYA